MEKDGSESTGASEAAAVDTTAAAAAAVVVPPESGGWWRGVGGAEGVGAGEGA